MIRDRRRSLHFVPGGNEKMIAKALTLPADGLILDLTRGKILDAVGNAMIVVCFIGSLVVMHRTSRLTRELLDQLRCSVPLPFAAAATTVHVSVTSQMALFSEGTCANCGQPPEAPDNLFVKCRSGHLIHLRCLVVEEDRPPRCPLCLRRRRAEALTATSQE